ncbi:MAG: pafB [Acidimicrobiales bacterium]|nr:pafB [Acidimicrobiales bacterium]
MAVSKLERLLNLMNLLLDAPIPLRAAELQLQVPGYPDDPQAFHRAFERDKDEMREMGVPLRIEPIPATDPPATGYRIRKQEFYLRDPGLEPDELEALNLAAATVPLDGGRGRHALWKLGGSVPGPGPALAELPADPNLEAAFQGVVERRVLRFRYRDVDREVHPYRLDFARGRWYLNGFDRGRAQERWYRLSRVDGSIAVDAAPAAFTRPVEAVPGLELDPWQLGGEDPEVRARVLVDADVAPSVVAELDPSQVEETRADGAVVLSFRVTNRDGFRSYLLAFLDHAEVLDPPELRAELVAWLEALAGAAP